MLILFVVGLYAFTLSTVADSYPHAWSIINSAFIPNSLYNGVIWKGKEIQEGLKPYLDLSPYVVKDNCRALCPYSKELLGENIAINYFDNAGHTAILPPWLMNDLLIRLRRVNPHVANRFEAELTYQAFYGMEKRKSY